MEGLIGDNVESYAVLREMLEKRGVKGRLIFTGLIGSQAVNLAKDAPVSATPPSTTSEGTNESSKSGDKEDNTLSMGSDRDYVGIYAACPMAFWSLQKPSATVTSKPAHKPDFQIYES
jgi:hypothetical protein